MQVVLRTITRPRKGGRSRPRPVEDEFASVAERREYWSKLCTQDTQDTVQRVKGKTGLSGNRQDDSHHTSPSQTQGMLGSLEPRQSVTLLLGAHTPYPCYPCLLGGNFPDTSGSLAL
jgi:hypothetical protein